MSIKTVNVGTQSNDGSGDSLREAFTKVNENFKIILSAATESGGVSDHKFLIGLDGDDHVQYALADGTRGNFASLTHTHATETNERIAADNILHADIATEIDTRIAADYTLQSNISVEASLRIAADNTLQANIISESTARVNAINSLANTINSHVGATGAAHGNASTSVAGFMSSTDKSKLDGIDASANNYTHPTSGATAGTYTKVTVDADGHATSGTTLSASDIPNLDASKITTGTIDAARLPSHVDDVIEAANLAGFPATGETGKIYVAIDTNKIYRWSGSAYVYITSGAVDSVSGKTGAVTLVKGDVGLGEVDNTSDATKPVSTATQSALNLKANLASPTLTGVPAAPTAAVNTNTTQIATTAFVNAEIANDAAPIAHVGATGTAHGNATTSVAGFMSSADKSKLDGIATSANNYTHPTSDGNLHVPATGTTNNGKILKAGSAEGELSWGTLTATDIGAQETLISGTNIKSINNVSLLGNGNLSIGGSGIASDVSLSTDNFTHALSVTDTNVQTAIETLDTSLGIINTLLDDIAFNLPCKLIRNPDPSSFGSFGDNLHVIDDVLYTISYDMNNDWKGVIHAINYLTGENLVSPFAIPDPEKNVYFGIRMKSNAAVVVISDSHYDSSSDKSLDDCGVVYIFNRQTQQLAHTVSASVAKQYNYFGLVISLSENYLAVSSGGLNYSDARVDVYNPTTGQLIQSFINPDNIRNEFGHYTLIVGDRLFVSAWGDPADYTNLYPIGKVHVYNIPDGSLIQTLTRPDESILYFGENVIWGNNTLIIGSEKHVCVYDPSSLQLLRYFEISNIGYIQEIAFLDDQNIAIGDDSYNDATYDYTGIIYIYNYQTGSYVSTIHNPMPTNDAYFGNQIVVDGPNLITNIIGATVDGIEWAGAIVVNPHRCNVTLIANNAALQSNIIAETSARVAADDTLQASIIAETSARIAANSLLQPILTPGNNIVIDQNNVISAVISGEVETTHGALAGLTNDDHPQYALADGTRGNFASLLHTHEAETSARVAADDTLQALIIAETSARVAVDNTLQALIIAETSARVAADDTLQALIIAETSARVAADDTLQALISSHVEEAGTAHDVATSTVAGFMSSTDKNKLDGIETNANNYTHPTSDGNLHIPETGTTNNGRILTAGSAAGIVLWGTLADIGAQATLVSGNNIKTINNISLLGSGNLTIGAEPGELPSRAIKSFTSTILNPSASESSSISIAKGFNLYKVAVSHPSWVRLYVSSAAQSADFSRTIDTDPLPGAGVLLELVTTQENEVYVLSPGIVCFNDDPTVSSLSYITITNNTASATSITANFTIVQTEG